MDYGKLAYLQVEDLKRQVSGISAVNTDKKIILSDDLSQKNIFTKNYLSPYVNFTYKKGANIEIFISFSLDLSEEYLSSITLYSNNVEIESKSFFTAAGNNFYNLNFLVDSLIEGNNSLHFKIITTETLASAISFVSIKMIGYTIDNKKPKLKVSLVEKGYLDKVMFGDGDLIKIYALNNGSFIETLKFKEYGDYSLCAYLFEVDETEEHDLLLFSVKHGKLFLTVIPVFAEYPTYTLLCEEGVKSVDSVGINNNGATVAYIKGNKVFISFIHRDTEGYYFFGKPVYETTFFPAPVSVKAVNNMAESFAYVITDASAKNHMLLAPQKFIRCQESSLSGQVINLFTYK